MGVLFNQSPISEAGSTMYEVLVQDDGGGVTTFWTAADNGGNIQAPALETAVQAFADSLGTVSGLTVLSVNKISVAKSPL